MIILMHNVYWFQGYPSRWGEERVAEVPEILDALTALYDAQKPDMLGLVEVHRADLAATLSKRLGLPAHLHAAGGLRPDYGGALLARDPARLSDQTRRHVPPHDRIHMRASLDAAGTPLEAALVHLPSNRYAGSREAGSQARVDELTRILAVSPQPHLIMGDMNCAPDSAPYALLRDRGYTDAAVATGDDSLKGRRVDYIWLDETWAKRIVRFASLGAPPNDRKKPDPQWDLSDHPPLMVELQ